MSKLQLQIRKATAVLGLFLSFDKIEHLERIWTYGEADIAYDVLHQGYMVELILLVMYCIKDIWWS